MKRLATFVAIWIGFQFIPVAIAADATPEPALGGKAKLIEGVVADLKYLATLPGRKRCRATRQRY